METFLFISGHKAEKAEFTKVEVEGTFLPRTLSNRGGGVVQYVNQESSTPCQALPASRDESQMGSYP